MGKTYFEFQKISINQYIDDWYKLYGKENQNEDLIYEFWKKIQLPERSTNGSAGYNFCLPFSFHLELQHSIVIPTGICCVMPQDCVLLIAPRSGQGFKYRVSLMNTIGVVDSDYYGAYNEGHILIKLTYDGVPTRETLLGTYSPFHDEENDAMILNTLKKPVKPEPSIYFEANKGFAQGIIVKYIYNDIVEGRRRVGGFGSTDK